MTVARRKGAPGKADRLFSLIVRSRGRCEWPGCASQGPYDTAHVIGRSFSGTRCEEDNAWCLCRSHHAEVDQWPHKKMWLVRQTIGEPRYFELTRLAEEYRSRPTTAARFWTDEAERLTVRCAELDIDTRRSA